MIKFGNSAPQTNETITFKKSKISFLFKIFNSKSTLEILNASMKWTQTKIFFYEFDSFDQQSDPVAMTTYRRPEELQSIFLPRHRQCTDPRLRVLQCVSPADEAYHTPRVPPCLILSRLRRQGTTSPRRLACWPRIPGWPLTFPWPGSLWGAWWIRLGHLKQRTTAMLTVCLLYPAPI